MMLLAPFNTHVCSTKQQQQQRLLNVHGAFAATPGHKHYRRGAHSLNSVRRVVRCEAVAAPAKTPAVADQFEPQVCAILGTQWGDEGKGKLVDILAQQYDIVARAQVGCCPITIAAASSINTQGGANAGHTIYDDDGNKYALHLIPSGILNRRAYCVIGNGVVVHLPTFFKEIEEFSSKGIDLTGRLLLSDRAHVLFDLHKEVDGLREAELAGNKIGTTKRGIGPAYASKFTRNGIRVGDLANSEAFANKLRTLVDDAARRFDDFQYDVDAELVAYRQLADRVAPYIADTALFLNQSIDQGKRVLIEGGQAAMLDIDFGTYPFVTSSNPTVGGIFAGLGLPPNKLKCIVGVVRRSRVGWCGIVSGISCNGGGVTCNGGITCNGGGITCNGGTLEFDTHTYIDDYCSAHTLHNTYTYAYTYASGSDHSQHAPSKAKAYTTRVGAGPYPTEIFGDLSEEIRATGHEYGTTTGRPRRVGWMDSVALNYACMYVMGWCCGRVL